VIITNSNITTINALGGEIYCVWDNCTPGKGGNVSLISSNIFNPTGFDLMGGICTEESGTCLYAQETNGTLTLNQSSLKNNFGEIKLSYVSTIKTNFTLIASITSNSVYVNSTSYSDYNKSANVTLNGLSINLANPKIYRDGTNLCNSTTIPSCYNFTSLNAGTVIFNVSSWSNYSIGEDLTPPSINFTGPTPSNGTIINVNSIKINTITNESDIDFKNYTYSLYNSIELVTTNRYPGGGVFAGYISTCFLKQNGSVQCQGSNTYGQANNYDNTDVIQVATGYQHTCFLKQNGSVQCQGYNVDGQANNYDNTDVIQISAGYTNTCFLKQNGSVQCQGDNNYGQADNYTGTDVIQVATGW
jgi:hypothetical protein